MHHYKPGTAMSVGYGLRRLDYVLAASHLGPEPVDGNIHSRPVEAVQQVKLRAGLGQFIPVEVLGCKTLAVIEAALSVRCGDDVLKPHPGDHDVPERLKKPSRRAAQRHVSGGA